ncbi:polyphenol oxidase family protein [Georgenia alba]|uniref:Polyphenol oxidase family protein n=1 Tax=Georgenia alba TaxID=2233858 RepID=A0ABW2Q784_9MICO
MIPGFAAAALPGARGGFTARAGGVSTGPYAASDGAGGLNLGSRVGDDDGAVRTNRARVAADLGAPVVWMRQVHGGDVHVVEGAATEHEPECDALVAVPGSGVGLGVLVADCVPVLLAEPSGVVGAVHVGRAGLVAGVLEATFAAMARLDVEPGRVTAVLGPSICGCCYEVPAQMRDDVGGRVPGTAAWTSWGTPSLDLPGGVRGRLAELGAGGVLDAGVCTLEDQRYYSHRRAGREGVPATGRFAGVVRAR